MVNSEIFKTPKPCVIKLGWYDAGREGLIYAVIKTDRLWGVVVWHEDEVPTLMKFESLEIK